MIDGIVARYKKSSGYAYHGFKRKALEGLLRSGLIPGAFSSYSEPYSEYDDGRHFFFQTIQNILEEILGI